MLILDHPSLDPFEPLVGDLFDYAFGDALRGLASAGIQSGDEWHTQAARIFKAACLPGFKRAQDAVGARVLDLERRIVSLKKQEAKERAKRNASASNQLKELQNVLQNRQLVLRRLMDGMLWVLIWPHRWVLRRLRLEGGIKRIDPIETEPLLESIAREHSKPDETFFLICDLTTVAQLGDLIIAQWNPDRNAMKIVVAELKVGRKNVLLSKRLHNPEAPDVDVAISKICQELGSNAAQQAARIARQERRLKDFIHVIATDEGVNPMSGQRFRMTRGTVSKDYRDQIRALIARAKSDG
ncbi:MAG: hypothetical protein ABSD47_03305, partial [Candidatus Methylomirabilota bacterium]